MRFLFVPILILLVAVAYAQQSQPTIILKDSGVEHAYPRLSRDGRSILYQSNKTGKWQLFICDIHGKNERRLTNDDFNNNFPDWSADNKWIAFVSDRDNNEEIYIMRTDASDLRRITTHNSRDIHPYFSPDGQYLLFNSDRNDNEFDVYRYTISSGTTERLTSSPENETCARYAPDMKSIVLLRNSEATDDVFILHVPSFVLDNLTQTPSVFHGWPMFSYDGQWVYYSSMEKGTYSLYRIKTDGTGKQQLTQADHGEEHARVSVSADGKFMIYNLKAGKTIAIVSSPLEAG